MRMGFTKPTPNSGSLSIQALKQVTLNYLRQYFERNLKSKGTLTKKCKSIRERDYDGPGSSGGNDNIYQSESKKEIQIPQTPQTPSLYSFSNNLNSPASALQLLQVNELFLAF